MKIDRNIKEWRIVSAWAVETRTELVESLIGKNQEDHEADKLRGRIRQLDDLLELPDQEFEE